MEGLEEEACIPYEYNIHHFLRNVCSPCLAELLSRELKNSKFIEEALRKDRLGTYNKTLYEILKNVHTRGKNAARNKGDVEANDGLGKTKHLLNLKENMSLLEEIHVWELMDDAVVNCTKSILALSKLDVAFLLNVLTNDELNLPLSGLEDDLQILKNSRNSITHKDEYEISSMWEAVKSIHRYLGKDMEALEAKRRMFNEMSLITFSPVIKKARQEIHSNQLHRQRVQYTNFDGGSNDLRLAIIHEREVGYHETVEDPAKFLKDYSASGNVNRPLILLCGAPGSGKSHILQTIAHQPYFLLVICIDFDMRDKKELFWNDIYNHLLSLCPNTVQQYGHEKVLEVLENYSDHYLFLWDMNLQDTRKSPPYLDRGTWVLSYRGKPEILTNCCVLTVACLSEKQVYDALRWMQLSDEHFNRVWECYKKCEYKRFINTPDMVHIFNDVCLDLDYCVPFHCLVQKYVNKKISNEEKLLKLGEKAFNAILYNKKCYTEKDLADIDENVYNLFMLSSSRGHYFQYSIVEDYLAAFYIVRDKDKACKSWLVQVMLFKRVFEIVLALWCEEEHGRVQSNIHFVREYLETFFEMTKHECKGRKHMSRNAAGGKSIEDGKQNEMMVVDGDDRRENTDDKKWNKQREEEEDNTNQHRRKRNNRKERNLQGSEELMEVDGNDNERRNNEKSRPGSHDEGSRNIQRREDRKLNKTEEAMEVEGDDDDDDKGIQQKQRQENQHKGNNKVSRQRNYDKKERKKQQKSKSDTEDGDDDTNPTIFVRWVFVSRLARQCENNDEILELIADLLPHKPTWRFKCKMLTEIYIERISVILQRVKLRKPLHIKIESGPNVAILNRLWSMLASHDNVCSNTTVDIQIHEAESNKLFMHENQLAKLVSLIAEIRTPLHVIKFIGPLFCSSTPQFLKCECMGKLQVLDVNVCDMVSLCQVLEHSQQSLIDAVVKFNPKLEQQVIPASLTVQISPTLPLTLKINYFKNLQTLLDVFNPPTLLLSLRIYGVYIHENFKLDLTRFTKMKSLFIRFIQLERPPHVYQEAVQTKVKTEVDNSVKSTMLPFENWMFQLVMHLHLPERLDRFLMRNLTFCNNSTAHLLYIFWKNMSFQRYILLDTNLSLSQFLMFHDMELEDLRVVLEKKFHFDVVPESQRQVVRRTRLAQDERNKLRKNKPEGRELIITSQFELCVKCQSFTCVCNFPSVKLTTETYKTIVSLAKMMYSSDILNVSYSGQGVVLRKDMCGDLKMKCPLPFLDDELIQSREHKPELELVFEALDLAQIICLTHTKLSHQGALSLINRLKERRSKESGTIEPFHLTILSCYYHSIHVSQTEVENSTFTRDIKEEVALKQFNFKCDCCAKCPMFTKKGNSNKCHKFKKTEKGVIYFNDKEC